MRSYPRNSPEAAARVLALLLVGIAVRLGAADMLS